MGICMRSALSIVDQPMTPNLRHWLWLNFGWDIYEWEPDDIRF